jgi:hypothetical protein
LGPGERLYGWGPRAIRIPLTHTKRWRRQLRRGTGFTWGCATTCPPSSRLLALGCHCTTAHFPAHATHPSAQVSFPRQLSAMNPTAFFRQSKRRGGGHRTETGERLTCRRLRCGWCPLSVRSITTCHPPVAEHARPPIAGRGRVRRRWLPALHNTQADEFSTPRHNSHNSSVIGFRSLVNAPHAYRAVTFASTRFEIRRRNVVRRICYILNVWWGCYVQNHPTAVSACSLKRQSESFTFY